MDYLIFYEYKYIIFKNNTLLDVLFLRKNKIYLKTVQVNKKLKLLFPKVKLI